MKNRFCRKIKGKTSQINKLKWRENCTACILFSLWNGSMSSPNMRITVYIFCMVTIKQKDSYDPQIRYKLHHWLASTYFLQILTCFGQGAPKQVQLVQRKRMQHPHCTPLSPTSQSMVYFLWKHTSPWLPFLKPEPMFSN